MNSLNLYNKEYDTNNKIIVTEPQKTNSYMLPRYGGYFKIYEKELTKPIVITVGPGGDFSTLNEGFREAMKYDTQRYLLDKEKPGDQKNPIIILLKTGFIMKESLHLGDGFNYSHIRIKTETFITCHRETLREDDSFTSYSGFKAFFYGTHGVNYPILEGKFKVDTSGESGGSSDTWKDHIFLIAMRYGSTITLTPGSSFEGGYYVVYINEGSTLNGHNCNYKGNKYTSQVIRLHSGEVDCGRSVIELGTELDPNIIPNGKKTCLHINEGGRVRLNNITFKNSPSAIVNELPISMRGCIFENITGEYAIEGKGLITEIRSNIAKIGNAKFTNYGINSFIPGRGVMIQ